MRGFVRVSLLAAALAVAGVATAVDLEADATAYLAQVPLTPANATEVDARCASTLAIIAKARAALEARTGPSTVDGDFAAYDTLALLLDDGSSEMQLFGQTHPSEEVRKAAERCQQQLSEAETGVSLSRPVYDRLAGIAREGLDDTTGFTLAKVLVAYRQNGVDKDAATRAKVADLKRQITDIGLEFAKNIRDDKGDIALDPADLAGVPQDFIDAHKPGSDGKVHLTYDYPDVFPVLEFGSVRQARRQVFLGFANRGYPANEGVLKRLLEKRYELATLLGFPDYATLVTADKMIGDPANAARFLEEVNAAASEAADADKAELAAFAQAEDASIDVLQRYDAGYFENRLRKARFAVDAAQVRQYFTYEKARAGIFGLMKDLFGADIRPWDTPVWHDSVTAW
jgi:thimet oligopeptidase